LAELFGSGVGFVTEQLNSIQQLLVEVQRSLQQPQPPPWAIYQQSAAQRQLLLRVKEVLALLADRSIPAAVAPAMPVAETAVAAMAADLSQLRGALLLPLQAEVEQLGQQRTALQAEIAELEAKLGTTQTQLAALESSRQLTPSAVMAAFDTAAGESQELALQQINDRTAQLAHRLDRTIQLTFNSLDQDVETYRIALKQQLEQLYDLGQRSESVVALLLQQVIDEAQQAARRYAETAALASPPAPIALSPEPVTAQLAASSQDAPIQDTPVASPPATDVIRALTELLPAIGLTIGAPVSPVAVPADTATKIPENLTDDLTLTGFTDLFEGD
jgi:predicted  nucleic acid-binding Zn-ribbon protein